MVSEIGRALAAAKAVARDAYLYSIDESAEVRAAVAINPSTGRALLSRLANDHNAGVKEIANSRLLTMDYINRLGITKEQSGFYSIMGESPVKLTANKFYEVHMVTCSAHLIYTLWTLHSFFKHAGSNFSLTIHDGGIDKTAKNILSQHFIGMRLLTETASRGFLQKQDRLKSYTNLFAARDGFAVGKRLLDYPFLARSEHMILLDSDVLFFARPDALLTPGSRFMVNSVGEINGGIGILPVKRFDYGLINRLVGEVGISWRTDEIVMEKLGGIERLPKDLYYCSIGPDAPDGRVAIHYTGGVRDLFWAEGVRHSKWS